MNTQRQIRLAEDYAEIQEYARLHPRIRLVNVSGDPPESYQIEYRISSLILSDDDVVVGRDHLVHFKMPADYPNVPPVVRVQSETFHPNIQAGIIDISPHWVSESRLVSLVMRVGEMLAYQRYDLQSAANSAAVDWINRHIDQLPLDEINMHEPVETASSESRPRHRAKPQAETNPSLTVPNMLPEKETVKLTCPNCQAIYFVRESADGKVARCKKCKQSFKIKL